MKMLRCDHIGICLYGENLMILLFLHSLLHTYRMRKLEVSLKIISLGLENWGPKGLSVLYEVTSLVAELLLGLDSSNGWCHALPLTHIPLSSHPTCWSSVWMGIQESSSIVPVLSRVFSVKQTTRERSKCFFLRVPGGTCKHEWSQARLGCCLRMCRGRRPGIGSPDGAVLLH